MRQVRTRLDAPNLIFSLVTGVLIGVYTLLDGVGGRVGSPHLFSAWLFVLTSFPILLIALAVRRKQFIALLRPTWKKGVAAGVVSALAYWIAIWAMSETPMGLVAALRESSVVFAAILGAVFLKERVRWIGVSLVFSGIALSKFA